ncbi:hypothetical protein I5535_09035 [Rhodobacteraceae bacterium F11138]|nr:hypothetical protein [Rhodobacteraceae bacterium F11138]
MTGLLRFCGVMLLYVLAVSSAWAQSPEDTVRWVYQSLAAPGVGQPAGLAALGSPERRAQFFSRRMVEFLAANDDRGTESATACIDFGLEIPGNDFDGAEILRSLSLRSETTPTRTTVTAAFSTFGSPARIEYDFVIEDGFWKIDDVAGPGYRVSLFSCAPTPSQRAPSNTSYCYQSENDMMRLAVLADGGADFEFMSWQSNGHTCSASGRARAVQGGWEYSGEAACRLRILVTPDQGLRLTDQDWLCKRRMCGQRAVVDGLEFARSDQIDCARMPEIGG